MLDEGKEADATAKLNDSIAADSHNDLAHLLMSTINDDPKKTLGEKYFKYTVKSGETLAKISGQYLGNVNKFYLLARYNGIRVPKSLFAGQEIKIPGKATAVAPPPPPPSPPSDQAERHYQNGLQRLAAGDKDGAYDDFVKAGKHPQARAEADKLRPELLRLHERQAREAIRAQNLDRCIQEWERVTELDPSMPRGDLQRCKDLKKELPPK